MKDNYDEIIKKALKENLEVPNVVKYRMNQTFNKIEKGENFNMKKIKIGKLISIAASLVLVLFLVGNGIAYATGNPNIYSFILEKLGIYEEYEEIKTQTNLVSESNGIKATLLDIGYDDNFLIVGYKLEGENLYNKILDNYVEILEINSKDKGIKAIETIFGLYQEIEIVGNGKANIKNIINVGEGENLVNDYKFCSVESDNSLSIYYICDISECIIDKTTNFKFKVYQPSLTIGDASPPVFEAIWYFEVKDLNKGEEILKKYVSKNAKATFEIQKEYGWFYAEDGVTKITDTEPIINVNGELGEVKISQIQLSKVGAIIKIDTNFEYAKSWNSDEKIPKYSLDIVDSKGNIIIEKAQIKAKGDDVYFSQKINTNENYTLKIYKYYEIDDQYIAIQNIKNLDYNLITSSEFVITENDLVNY